MDDGTGALPDAGEMGDAGSAGSDGAVRPPDAGESPVTLLLDGAPVALQKSSCSAVASQGYLDTTCIFRISSTRTIEVKELRLGDMSSVGAAVGDYTLPQGVIRFFVRETQSVSGVTDAALWPTADLKGTLHLEAFGKDDEYAGHTEGTLVPNDTSTFVLFGGVNVAPLTQKSISLRWRFPGKK